MSPLTPPLTDDEEHELYCRLVASDPVAPADLAASYLDHLTAWLVQRNPSIDPSYCANAAEDAIIALAKNPASYKPEKLSLAAYLRMSASGDLKNALARERRHALRRVSLDAVEHSAVLGKEIGDESQNPEVIMVGQEALEERVAMQEAIQERLRLGLSSAESRVLQLMGEGERHTATYADVLGILDLPVAEQRRQVKRVKDRLEKRLARARGTHD